MKNRAIITVGESFLTVTNPQGHKNLYTNNIQGLKRIIEDAERFDWRLKMKNT